VAQAVSGVSGRTGAKWERIAVDYAAGKGLPWDRAPLRGTRDLLDTQGCLPAGFLVGYKGIRRFKSGSQWLFDQQAAGRGPSRIDAYEAGQKSATFGAKISEAMDQCDRALLNLGRPAVKDGNSRLLVDCGGIIPVQVMQRAGYPPGKAYVVTELDYFLDLAVRRAKWRNSE